MKLRLAVLADLHVAPSGVRRAGRWHGDYDYAGVRARLRTAVAEAASCGADWLVVLGDLTDDGDRATWLEAVEILESARLPLALVVGNHDASLVRRREATLSVGWPSPYRERCGEVSFLDLPPAPGRSSSVAPPMILLSHYPVLSRSRALRDAGLPDAGTPASGERLAAELSELGAPVLVLCGHLHVHDTTAEGQLLQLSCAPLVEPPHALTLVDLAIASSGITVRRRLLKTDPGRLPPNVIAPLTESFAHQEDCWIPAQRPQSALSC